MTPAVRLLEAQKIPFTLHQYQHDASAESFGEEAAAKLGVDAARVFKTLVAMLDETKMVAAIVPVAGRLDLKKLAAAAGAKRANLADPKLAEKATGFVVGGISPIGGRKVLPTFLDETAPSFETILVSAGLRGWQIEIKPGDLQLVSGARLAALSRE